MKEIRASITLNLKAGKATPAPPIGSMLGQFGINLSNLCKEYNDLTKMYEINTIIPMVILIYKDLSYSFTLKTSPVSLLIKQKLNLQKGAKFPSKEIISSITYEQIKEIAQIKLSDLNTQDLNVAIKIIIGTLKNMGIQFLC